MAITCACLPPSTPPTASAGWRTAPRRRRGELPDYLIPLGRTIGIGANGAVSNLSPLAQGGIVDPRRELRAGRLRRRPHPRAAGPADRLERGARHATSRRSAPSTPTRPRRSPTTSPRRSAPAACSTSLSARIAVSEAAAWTGRRWYGGRYEIIPNGVDIDAAPTGPKPASEELRVLFVGRAEERKGLPILLSAFGALAEHVPCRLTVIGAERGGRRCATSPTRRRCATSTSPAGSPASELWRQLHDADLLCAPSLSGESFGMVLTEAFAAGTPVDRLGDRRLQRRRHRRRRRRPRPAGRPAAPRRGAAARLPRARAPAGDGGGRAQERRALRLAAGRRPRHRGLRAGDRGARAGHGRRKVRRRTGLRPADGDPPAPAQRLPSLDPPLARRGSRRRRVARRAGLSASPPSSASA